MLTSRRHCQGANDQIIPGKIGIAQFYGLVEQSFLDTCLVVYALANPLKAFEGDSTGNPEHPEAANIFKGSMVTPLGKISPI